MINVDFADIRAVMRDAGSALMGVGIASGEGRAEKAALQAINSPLLDLSISGAKACCSPFQAEMILVFTKFKNRRKS